ncbi:MAG: aminotransferase class IV [Bacteroidetes bacterium]|jgi:branched-subunit amino acid aminotransferase/4-amino-4-deoxychorismate lyase|nr:aminotransferase class IV [Bacteroidota bacterium]MBT6685861.1 aminotransferase class IV [Bacteroidota bacterium]MBT7144075.1 aminotransferase class IV [Bacteroidota bacterium]MBT7490997.1 aminotransferase class IV [Bacteroidota bacterium]
MRTLKYCSLNGKFFQSNKSVLTIQNRSFRYGDGLFETMRANGKEVFFFENHLERLMSGMKILKMKVPLSLNISNLRYEINSLFDKNHYYQGARVRLSVFRNEGGYYTPITNEISYLIEIEKLSTSYYELNAKGLIIDFYSEIYKSHNKFANIKSNNAQLFVLAGIYKTEKGLDDCIIQNSSENIVETISSNIFFVVGDKIFTPNIQSGCVNGVMRKQIISIAKSRFEVIETELNENICMEAEEVFITNAIQGINWVMGLGQKRFFSKISRLLISELNNKLNF